MWQRKRRFYYQGQAQSGEPISGMIEQWNADLARTELLHLGVHQVQFQARAVRTWRRLTRRDVHELTRQLSLLLQAQLPLMQILDLLSRNLKHPGWTPIINRIREDVRGGRSLAAAFRAHPKLFDGLFCSLIAAGEQTGALGPLCARLVQHQNRHERLQQQLRTVFRYPLIVLSIAIGLGLLLLLQVVPTFADLFSGLGGDLPNLTARLMQASNALRSIGIPELSIGLGLISLLVLIGRGMQWQKHLRILSFQLPLVGHLQQTAALAILCHTLGLALQAGVPLLASVQIAVTASQHPRLLQQLTVLMASLSAGNPLYQTLSNTRQCPELLLEMIETGEQSGALEHVLERAGHLYDEQLDNHIKALSTWLEPILMVLLAVLVGGLLLALYLPVFTIGQLL